MEREEQIKKLKLQFDEDLSKINNLNDLNDLRVNYLGKKSDIIELSKMLGSMDEEARKKMGALLNEARNYISESLDNLKSISSNPAFDFLKEEPEIYSVTDGIPIND
jgi:phenylalanyl-tRNA synthetase alpha chain